MNYEYEKYITDNNNILETITAKLPVPIKKDKTSTWTSYNSLYRKHSLFLKL